MESFSAKTKHDGRTDRRTDRRGGGGGVSISPVPAGDKNVIKETHNNRE